MRKVAWVGVSLLFSAAVAMGQAKTGSMADAKPAPAAAGKKIQTKWHCDKPSEQHQMDAGDMDGHSYSVDDGACTATDGGPMMEKTGKFVEMEETAKGKMMSNGTFVSTLDNGDMLHYSYTVAQSAGAKMVMNHWKITGGTGKEKDVKGSGTCSGKMNDDGSIDWVCKGSYMMMAAMAKTK